MYALYISVAILLAVNCCLSAPLAEQQHIETDPELTAGYYQGDIVLGNLRNGLSDENIKWPNNIVYYKFFTKFDDAHHNHILRGMRLIEEISCIRFKEADAAQKAYVNITGTPGGCYSNVGFSNEVQVYNLQIYPLDQGCFRLGTIVHEFLHTLGFLHMQSASNRDDYVRIAEENIQDGTLHNFEKLSEEESDHYDEEYDYGSVLHYSAYAFSANGEMTIIPLKEEDAAGIMGQRRGMSKSDINKLNVMYSCPLHV